MPIDKFNFDAGTYTCKCHREMVELMYDGGEQYADDDTVDVNADLPPAAMEALAKATAVGDWSTNYPAPEFKNEDCFSMVDLAGEPEPDDEPRDVPRFMVKLAEHQIDWTVFRNAKNGGWEPGVDENGKGPQYFELWANEAGDRLLLLTPNYMAGKWIASAWLVVRK